MEPQRHTQATLDDLLERVLDTGIVIKLDLVIGVAGIPLIGISLQGAIAAIETMLDYGLMEAWDADSRAYAVREELRRQIELAPGERSLLELYGSYHQTEGISRVWRPGRLILTDRRLVLFRPAPREVLFEADLADIAGIGRLTQQNLGGGRREILRLALAGGALASIYTSEPDRLEAGLRERLSDLGISPADLSGPDGDGSGPDSLAEGQLWRGWERADGETAWKSGWAVLEGHGLTWRADTAGLPPVRVPLSGIRGLRVERRELGALGERDVLVLAWGRDGQPGEELFAGDGVEQWSAAIRSAALAHEGGDDA